jgi:hypothetical protein
LLLKKTKQENTVPHIIRMFLAITLEDLETMRSDLH